MFVCTVVGFDIEFFSHQDVIFMDATLGCWMVSLLLTDNKGECGLTVAGETGVWEVLVQMNLHISSVQERSTSFNIFKVCVKKGFKLADL
jgi:hypothetical protein